MSTSSEFHPIHGFALTAPVQPTKGAPNLFAVYDALSGWLIDSNLQNFRTKLSLLKEGKKMETSKRVDTMVDGFKWIASNPDVFNGKPIIVGSRFSVSFVLGCLSDGMTPDEIELTYRAFPKDCVTEVLRFAEALANKPMEKAYVGLDEMLNLQRQQRRLFNCFPKCQL